MDLRVVLYFYPMKKNQANILIVDDQEDIIFSVKVLLKKHFQHIHTATNPRKIIEILQSNTIDVVLLDMNYRIGFEDGKEGIYYLKEIKKTAPQTNVILMTAFGKIETAVEGIKLGAYDYILKPWENHKLIDIVKKAVIFGRKNKTTTIEKKPNDTFFIGTSQLVKQAYMLANKVAKTDANVLILGENGTGKYVMAKHIHQQSNRKDKPFIHVDLGALSEHIFESELFGYAKGAFTDAKTDTAGRFETAENGTVFLDEIGNLPLHLQAKLLQILQNKTITRLGESKPRKINARIITATNTNLKQAVKNNTFREDLYYRINTMEIELPPLRNCEKDKLPLADFLRSKIAKKYDRKKVAFDANAKEQIKIYSWKGNIRELQNKIERAIIVCENNTITAEDLDLEIHESDYFLDNKTDKQLATIEKESIERVLLNHDYNISQSAKELGLSRASLYRRIEKYQIPLKNC